MIATKKRLIAQYGREVDDTLVMVCPECDPEQEFGSLEEWKDHMTKMHGGYSVSEVASGLESSKGEPHQNVVPPEKPKRMSARARELNEKLNRCIALVIKHLISSITDEERAEIEANRTVITEAFIGIEFDFEERLISITGKWAVLVVLGLLYILPSLPSMREMIAKSKESHKVEPHKNVVPPTKDLA